MTCTFRFLLSFLWLCFAVSRYASIPNEGQETLIDEGSVLFAPEKLLPRGNPQPSVLALWKERSHLRPKRSKGRSLAIPSSYWLILLAGDVEANPGPIKYPCSVCNKSMKSNQKGVSCDECEKWTHAKCCGISVDEYQEMTEREDTPWICPRCTRSALPFADSTLDSCLTNTDISLFDLSNTSENSSPLDVCTEAVIFCHLNTQSLLNKMDELQNTLSGAKRPVVFGASETWLDATVLDGEVIIPSYDLHRRDRDQGVLMYVPERCKSKRRYDLEPEDIEIVWVEMRLRNRAILVGSMYSPPHSHSHLFGRFEAMLEKVSTECKDIILMGDLNVNLLVPSSLSSKLLMIASENNLQQLITEPTRVTDRSRTLIDVLFTSNPDLFITTGTAQLTGSDHSMVYGECNARVRRVHTVRSFKRCNIDILIQDLKAAPWQVMHIFDQVDDVELLEISLHEHNRLPRTTSES